MKKHQKMGIGKEVSMRIFDMFPGGWEISQWTNNLPAQRFWIKVIDEYTNGKYTKFSIAEKNEVGFTFDNSLQQH